MYDKFVAADLERVEREREFALEQLHLRQAQANEEAAAARRSVAGRCLRFIATSLLCGYTWNVADDGTRVFWRAEQPLPEMNSTIVLEDTVDWY